MPDRLVIPEAPEVADELPVAHPWWQWSASFNVAVSRNLPVARMHDSETEGVIMRWGLVHRGEGEQTLGFGPALISSELLPGAGELRRAWLSGQRGIVPIAGFYVWQRTAAGFRQPYYVRLGDRSVFGIAAIWQRCTSTEDDVIESCALLTVPANPMLLGLNNSTGRMPVILSRHDYEVWLGSSVGQALELLHDVPEPKLVSHPVGPYVNHLSFDGPQLIRPVSPYVPARTYGLGQS
jgi:putative SOS response-associated peptidase YedK